MNRRVLAGGVVAAVLVIGMIFYMTVARTLPGVDTRPQAGPPKAQAAQAATPFLVGQRQAISNLPTLRIAAKAHPRDVGALVRLGNAELRTSAFPDAIAAYRGALAIDPQQGGIWSSLGEAYLQTGRNDGPKMPPEARAAFDKALAIDRNDLRAHFYLALEKDFSGQHDEALGELIAMLSVVPTGSQPDVAIRAAITTSIKRNLGLVKQRIDEAVRAQASIPPAPAA